MENNLNKVLKDATDVLNEEIKVQFVRQGHHLTGAWEDSLKTEIIDNEAIGTANDYGSIVNAGVPASRIPFGKRKGGANSSAGSAETSAYIMGLFNYWKLRKPGISDKEAMGLAFATANVQKREGMSTINSRIFSLTSKRQRFMNDLDMTATNKVMAKGIHAIIKDECLTPNKIYVQW